MSLNDTQPNISFDEFTDNKLRSYITMVYNTSVNPDSNSDKTKTTANNNLNNS